TTQTRAAHAQLSLAMTINSGTAKAGQTRPVQLTLRNDGPDDATQIEVRSSLPPGACYVLPTNQPPLDGKDVIPRLAAGAQVQLSGLLFARFDGTFTLIANVTSFEQELPAGAA